MKTNGVWCGSPALHGQDYCYFHDQWRRTKPNLNRAAQPPAAFELPLLEDANAIQVALQRVIQAILDGQLDNKKAGLILYALQTASSNLKRTNFEPAEELEQQALDDQAEEDQRSGAEEEERQLDQQEQEEAVPIAHQSPIARSVGAPPFAQRSGAKGGNIKPPHRPPASELSEHDLMKMIRALAGTP